MENISEKKENKIKKPDRKVLIIGGIVVVLIIVVLCIALKGANAGSSETTAAEQVVAETPAKTETQAKAETEEETTAVQMTAPDGSIYIPETGGELVLPNPEDYPKGYGPTYEGEDLTGTWRETTVGKATMELNEDGTGSFNSGVDFTWYAGDGLFFTFYDERFGNTVPGQYNIIVENGATILKEVAEDGAVFER